MMQEPPFRTFLHHFLSNPLEAARIRGVPYPRQVLHVAYIQPCGGACAHGRIGFGPRSDEKRSTTDPRFSAVCRQSNDFSASFSPILFSSRHKTPSSEPIFLLPKISSHRFPRHSTLIHPAAAEELTMKPRCGEFHRQFSPIPGNLPILEVRFPFEAEPSRSIPPLLHRIFSLPLKIQQTNPI